MKKVVLIIAILLLSLTIVPICALAHSGGTDSSGGHYDHSTGEYHYHHGRPAHDHPNGVCPYSSSNKSSTSGGRDAGDIIAGVILVVLALIVFPAPLWDRLWENHKRKKKEKEEREEQKKWESIFGEDEE